MVNTNMQTQTRNQPESDRLSTRSALTFDLGGDLDLEAQIGPSISTRPLSSGEGSGYSTPRSTIVGDVEAKHCLPDRTKLPATLPADDPTNPKNWGTARKLTVTLVLCAWVLSLTYSSTAYVASLPALMQRFHVSQEVAILGVTLFVLGFAAGPLIFGPLSEIYGRRAVYCASGLFYSAFSFAMAFAPNAPSLLIFRFFAGFFGAASINNVPASIGDYTNLVQRGYYTILYALMAFGGPSLGPLVSAFVQHDAGFRWNLRVMAILSTVLSIMVAFVPETHGPTLLKWRLAKDGEKAQAGPSMDLSKLIGLFKIALSRPIVYLFTEPPVMLVSIFLSILYGILYGFFEAFSVVYIDIRRFEATSYGLTYISLGLGFVVACILLATVGQTIYMKSAEKAAAEGVSTQPEARLALAYYGAVLSPISLFIFAWTAPFTSVHWIAPCIAEFLFACSTLLIFTGFIPFLIDTYQMTAASALAAGMASRALVGSAFPLFALQMYKGMTVQGATSLLAGIACLLAPIPFVFKVYGPRMRARSRYASQQ